MRKTLEGWHQGNGCPYFSIEFPDLPDKSPSVVRVGPRFQCGYRKALPIHQVKFGRLDDGLAGHFSKVVQQVINALMRVRWRGRQQRGMPDMMIEGSDQLYPSGDIGRPDVIGGRTIGLGALRD